MATVRLWIEGLDYLVDAREPALLCIKPPGKLGDRLPPFYVQLSENWLLLSMLPFFPPDTPLSRRAMMNLLVATRDMRTAKFAMGEGGEVVLCAELPTESLDESEVKDAIERIIAYAVDFGGFASA